MKEVIIIETTRPQKLKKFLGQENILLIGMYSFSCWNGYFFNAPFTRILLNIWIII